MLNNFIAAKLHKRKCYKRIKPKAIKQAYLGLFLALSWSLYHCHSIHRASGETRRIFWWKYRRGFMRESRGKIWRKFYVLGSWENHSNDMCCNILWYDWNSLLCLKKFCYSMFLCLVDFGAVFLFCFVCTNVAFKYFLILWFFTRNLLISFRCFRLNVRWRIIGLCFTYRSFTFTQSSIEKKVDVNFILK